MSTSTKLWYLWFVFITIPGSGFLISDGLPFASKLEFSIISFTFLFVVVSALRLEVAKFVSKFGVITDALPIVIIGMIFLKVFSFAILPLGDGFESCYQSIYEPDKKSFCEKSYDSPFITEDNINAQGSLTRIEPSLDFFSTNQSDLLGASGTTWKLPFANDYPRLSALWLDRLPFSAQFGTVIFGESGKFLPISYSGELEVIINDVYQGKFLSYKSKNLAIIPITDDYSILKLRYRFTDDNSSEIPDQAPKISGPWAHLQVFQPISQNDINESVQIRFSGWTFDPSSNEVPAKISINTESGREIASNILIDRVDVAYAFKNDSILRSGFDIRVKPAQLRLNEQKLLIHAIYNNSKKALIGEVYVHPTRSVLPPNALIINTANSQSDFRSERQINNEKISVLKGLAQRQPNAIQKMVLFLIDAFSFFVLMSLTVIALRSLLVHRQKILFPATITVFTTLIVWSSNQRLPIVSIFTLLLLGMSFFVVRRGKSLNPGVFLLPVIVLASKTAWDLSKRYTGLGSADWWNFLIWRSRDSDWFVTQGHARQIFTHDSLRGGEGLFYFQPGNRYLVFLQHLIFGDNDILVVMLWVGFLSFFVLSLVVICHLIRPTIFVGILLSSIPLVLLASVTDPGLTVFALSQASEYPTWITIVCVFFLLLYKDVSERKLLVATVLLALSHQFRPNQALGSLALFLVLILSTKETISTHGFFTRAKISLVFGMISSLSLLHNLHYSKTFEIFSSTGQLNSDFPFSDILRSIYDSEVRSIVLTKLRLALDWSEFSLNNINVFHLMQLVWLIAIVRMLTLKILSLRIWLMLSVPLLYLIPLLPFRFESYYPRHIVIIQFSFALSAFYAFHQSSNKQTIQLQPTASIKIVESP